MQAEHPGTKTTELPGATLNQRDATTIVKKMPIDADAPSVAPQQRGASAVTSNDILAQRRDDLGRKLETLRMATDASAGVLRSASADELALLEQLAERAGAATHGVEKPDTMSLDQYRSIVERLGEEYVGTLTSARLQSVGGIRRDELQYAIEEIADMSRLIRSIPPGARLAMWPAMQAEMKRMLAHYQRLKHVIVEMGVAAALDAERYVALTQLHRDMVPALDLTILRMAGEVDPELALLGYIRSARLARASMPGGMTVAQLLDESEKRLQLDLGIEDAKATEARSNAPATPAPKRWTAWGKMFAGVATAGANVAGGVALWSFGGPLAGGVTLGSVIASCATGVGAVLEGVGVLRGE